MKIEVVLSNPAWREKFQSESRRIALVMGENVVAIHPMGSTGPLGVKLAKLLFGVI
jgi:GrpB-like predicted nucleotidyltransferase (UPF0157 family)